MRQRRGRHQGRVRDIHAMVHLVALLQTAQDGDGVLDIGLLDQHLLESTLQGGVFFHVFAILVQRGGAYAVELTSRQRGLEHIAGIHRTFGLARTDHVVDFIDEQDDIAFLFLEIIQYALQALFKLAPELGASDQRAHIQRQHALAANAFRHLAIDDALGQAFNDGGFADTGLTNQHRVVLGAPLQHLDRAPNLLVTADHRVKLGLLGPLGQVDGVFLQRLARLLGIRVDHLLTAAHVLNGFFQGFSGRAGFFQKIGQHALELQRRQDKKLAGDVLVTALLRDFVGDVQQLDGLVREIDLPGRARDPRQAVQALAQRRAKHVHAHAGLGQQVARGAALLVQQRDHNVHRLDELMIHAHGQALGLGQGQLEFAGQFVHSHGKNPRILGRAACPANT